VKSALRIVIGVVFSLLGFGFAAIAGTAIGVFATHTYRFRTSPMIAFSIFSVLALLSFIAAKKLIWSRKVDG
jgi:hypothetical protein